MSYPKKIMISWFILFLLLVPLVIAEDIDNETNPGDLNKDGDDNDVNEDDWVNGLDDSEGIVDPGNYTVDFWEMVDANLVFVVVGVIAFAIVIIVTIIVVTKALRRRPDEPPQD